ncbi:uroporphyrinogen decarboxylase family protein [Oerskovia sp. M15]
MVHAPGRRSLPEYRELRQGIGMLDSCLRPDLASEITLQPVRRHDVDAGIFFSDIVIPLKLAGWTWTSSRASDRSWDRPTGRPTTSPASSSTS